MPPNRWMQAHADKSAVSHVASVGLSARRLARGLRLRVRHPGTPSIVLTMHYGALFCEVPLRVRRSLGERDAAWIIHLISGVRRTPRREDAHQLPRLDVRRDLLVRLAAELPPRYEVAAEAGRALRDPRPWEAHAIGASGRSQDPRHDASDVSSRAARTTDSLRAAAGVAGRAKGVECATGEVLRAGSD